jgi:branched-chain amino acid transport system ATP-binding protein
MDTPDLRNQLDAVSSRYKLDDYRNSTVSALAQGVRKLLDIAMAVVSKPRVLLLDEPTSGISVEEKFDFMDVVMGALKEDGVTVLFVEHDMEIVARYVSRVLAFYQGEIIADMPPRKALSDKKVQEFVIGKEHHKKKK